MKARTLVLWIVILLSLAGFFFLYRPRKDRVSREEKQCFRNLEQILAPMRQIAQERKLGVGTPLPQQDIVARLPGGALPRCPAGADYFVVYVVGGPPPRCPVHGDLIREMARRKHR